MRILLGLFEAALNPCSYSLVSDYFPPESRTKANAVITFGKYAGQTMQSLTIILIEAVGWRLSFQIVGLFGVLTSVILLVFVREPGRGVFDPKKIEEKDEQAVQQLPAVEEEKVEGD